MLDTSNAGEAYDQMIGAGNDKGNKIVQDVIDGLVSQTRAIEGVVSALGLEDRSRGLRQPRQSRRRRRRIGRRRNVASTGGDAGAT